MYNVVKRCLYTVRFSMQLETEIYIEKLISKHINPWSTASSTFKLLPALIALECFKVDEEDHYRIRYALFSMKLCFSMHEKLPEG